MNSKRSLIERDSPALSISQQCDLVGLNRASFYYRAQGLSCEELDILNAMDEIFTEHPYYGHRKLYHELKRRGFEVGRDRALKYMGILGLEPLHPRTKKLTTIPSKQHQIYPYLLKDLEIVRPNQVWAVDITYIRLQGGFCYLVVIVDWFSRLVLGWRVSNSLDAAFCLEALGETLERWGQPEIFNSDQGSQFTSEEFTAQLLQRGILVSMDSKGRALDNIIVERFFRSLKYEDIYVNHYASIPEVRLAIGRYIEKFNRRRIHASLDYRTPWEVYWEHKSGKVEINMNREMLLAGV